MTAGQRQDIELDLVTDTPLHVGGTGGDRVVDLPLTVDGQGRLMVPGSSWAGALRAFAARFPELDVTGLFGSPGGDPDGHASRVYVADTLVGLAAGVEVRTGVGIDRRTGAAAHGILYDRMVLPAGTELRLYLRHEGPATDDLTRLVALVRAAGLRLGAGTGRGLGRLRCVAARQRRTDLTERASLLAALAGRTGFDDVAAATGVDHELPRIELTWEPRRPIVVGAPTPAASADLVPLTIRDPAGGLVPVLPGSSVKGALRSLAERVLRTVLELEPPDPDFVAAMDDLAGRVPAFEVLFGSRGRAGALCVADTSPVGVDPVAADLWRTYLTSGDRPAQSWWAERTHVALDRWTGGAAPHRLFTVQEPTVARWAPLRLELDPARLDGVSAQCRRAAVLLLGVVVGLLREGGGGFGHGLSRGLGEIAVTGVEVVGTGRWEIPEPDPDVDWWDWLRELACDELLSDVVTAPTYEEEQS